MPHISQPLARSWRAFKRIYKQRLIEAARAARQVFFLGVYSALDYKAHSDYKTVCVPDTPDTSVLLMNFIASSKAMNLLLYFPMPAGRGHPWVVDVQAQFRPSEQKCARISPERKKNHLLQIC